MKRQPIWLVFSLAFCVCIGLASIGAGVREVWNPRTILHGNTALTTWSIPVAISGTTISNSICAESGTNWNISGSITTGPHTNTTSAGYANYQSSATGTNYFAGPVGIGVIPTTFPLKLYVANADSVAVIGSGATGDAQLKIDSSNGDGLGADYFTLKHFRSGNYFGIGYSTADDLLINSSGNVGIGRINQLAILDVNGGVNIGSTAFDPGANNLYVQGNAGFGTNSPQARIHVGAIGCTTAAEGIQFGNDVSLFRSGIDSLKTDDAFSCTYLYVGNLYNRTSGSYGTVNLGGASSSIQILRNVSDSTAVFSVFQDNATATGDLQQWQTDVGSAGTVAVVNSNGYFGLGRTAPLARLDVNGGVNIGATSFDPGANNLSVKGSGFFGGHSYFTNTVMVGTNQTFTTARVVPENTGRSSLELGPYLQAETTKTNLVPDLITSPYKFDNSGTPSINKWAFYVSPGAWTGGYGMSANSLDAIVGPGGGFSWYTGATQLDGTGVAGIAKLTSAGDLGLKGSVTLTNSTDVAADPAATTGVQWQSTGGWEYRNSVASEGAGQINRVHNRAAQVVGVGTDYSLTQTKTNVTFGTSGGSIALPTAGTYTLHCLANFASTTAADDLHFYLWDSTNNVVVPGSWQHHESHANNDHDVTPLTAIYTVTTNVHIWLGAVNVTAARGVIVSTNTILTYVRCY